MNRKIESIAYVHGPQIGMITFMLFGAIVEMACGLSLGLDNPIGFIAYHASMLFMVAALCGIWCIVRFEQRVTA
jgi:hypothetical protein